MFKRSLASFAAVAVASGAVVAPANAMTLTVNDDKTCTIKVTEEEAGLIGLTPPAKIDKDYAAHLKATLLGRVSYMRNQTRIAASTTPARYVTASLS